jgi:uncharacterized membrane protein YoaK (UPF0700 family)
MTRTSTTLRFALLITLACGFLDAYTYVVRGGVFANAQTGNVIFFALGVADGSWAEASAHLWAIIAFMCGVGLSSHIKAGRLDVLGHPLRWALAVQALVLIVIGFVPASVPPTWVTVPISFVTAMLIGLFRNIGELSYIAVATTGNLMRLVEAGYDALSGKTPGKRPVGVYAAIVGAFAFGAVVGGFGSKLFAERAVWIPAALLAFTLILFIADSRTNRGMTDDPA